MSKVKIPKSPSRWEELFALYMRANEFPPYVREFKFAEGRRWRFDFAWVHQKVAVEIEGGTWNRGRHTRGKGFQEDCNKYNHAAALGWRVLRLTGDMVKNQNFLGALESMLE